MSYLPPLHHDPRVPTGDLKELLLATGHKPEMVGKHAKTALHARPPSAIPGSSSDHATAATAFFETLGGVPVRFIPGVIKAFLETAPTLGNPRHTHARQAGFHISNNSPVRTYLDLAARFAKLAHRYGDSASVAETKRLITSAQGQYLADHRRRFHARPHP